MNVDNPLQVNGWNIGSHELLSFGNSDPCVACSGCRLCQPNQTARAWGQWVAPLAQWGAFGALTLDQRTNGSREWEKTTSGEVFRHMVTRWLRDGEQVLGRKLQAVVAVEYQKNGWPHAHPLVAAEGGLNPRTWGPSLQWGDISKLRNQWMERRARGWAKLEVPRSVGAVATYASKYLSKGLETGDVILWGLGSPTSK